MPDDLEALKAELALAHARADIGALVGRGLRDSTNVGTAEVMNVGARTRFEQWRTEAIAAVESIGRDDMATAIRSNDDLVEPVTAPFLRNAYEARCDVLDGWLREHARS